MKSVLLIFLGGGIGTVLRYLISKISSIFFTSNFPLGTFISNTVSCIIVAFVVYVFAAKGILDKKLTLFLVTGVCGGLSTFSTFNFETFELIKQGFWGVAILNVGLSLLIGIGAIYIIYNRAIH